MKKKKRIAVLGIKGLPSKGGGERVAEAIIDKALQSNFDVTVYAKKSYSKKEDLPTNVRMVLINEFSGKHLSAFSYGLFSAFHALLFGKYDLIHLHYADFGFIVPLLRLRFKVIGTSHGAEYNRDKWNYFAKKAFGLFEVLFCKYTNVCTSVSKSLGTYYEKTYNREVIFIPNGVYFNEKNDYSGDYYKKFDVNKNEYLFFAAGRIIPTKGLEYLLEANKKLNLRIPIIIAGNIENNPDYKRLLESFQAENVHYVGFIKSKERLFNLIQNSRLFVFPSTYEAMSIILLEVASLKKGIVCSDIIQNVDAIEDNTIYFRSADVDSLSNVLEDSLRNIEEVNIKAKKTYLWVEKNRNWENITQKYMDIYMQLIKY